MLYGLGKKSLAERLYCSEEEADDIIQGLYTSFPKLREYVATQQQYPFNHSGYINTMLGDKLKVKEYELWEKAPRREKNNLQARTQRLGVNLPIQGKKCIAVYSSDTIEDNWAKSKNGESPNIEITRYLTNI